MVASAKRYDSIPNTDNHNNNAANNVNAACTSSEDSSLLVSGGSQQDVMIRSPSSSRRSPFAVMAAGFLVTVVLLAFTTNNRDGGQQAALQELRYDGGGDLLWGRSRESGAPGGGVATVDDDHSDDDSGHTRTRTRTFEADDDGDAISDSTSDLDGSSGSDSDSDLTPKHHKPPKCSFLNCWAAKCSWDLAPYVCLRHNGGPHMGWYVLLCSVLLAAFFIFILAHAHSPLLLYVLLFFSDCVASTKQFFGSLGTRNLRRTVRPVDVRWHGGPRSRCQRVQLQTRTVSRGMVLWKPGVRFHYVLPVPQWVGPIWMPRRSPRVDHQSGRCHLLPVLRYQDVLFLQCHRL